MQATLHARAQGAGARGSAYRRATCVPPGRPTRRRPSPTRAAFGGLESLISSALQSPAAPVAAVSLQFTPLVAAAGGAVLGLAAVCKWLVTGRILGISGTLKGLVTGDRSSWRWAFLAGLLGGGAVAGAVTPGAFGGLPDTYTVSRAALGGLLVGVGASMGNGCTSGHGICGNARLSPRSFAYTLVFMAAGAAAATLTGSAAALGVVQQRPPLVLSPSDVVANQGAMLLATALLAVGACGAAARRAAAGAHQRAGALLTEVITGALFAWGLTYSTMVSPAKVAAFLSPLAACWDPTLAFVMGGALAVALPGFQWAARSASAPPKPLCCDAFASPPTAAVDARLCAGGALFGAGWGISGACPGPALVAIAASLSPPPQIAAYVAAMCAGFWLEGAVTKALRAQPA